MNIDDITASEIMIQIEALIFASNEPIDKLMIATHLSNYYEYEVHSELIDQALDAVIEKYNADYYPFEVKRIGGGYQFLSKIQYHDLVGQINGDKFNKKLSATAMETLAIIAYRQPITKSDVEYIRGVSADYAIHKLLEKELITVMGRDEEAVGKPILYGTSRAFFDYLGINDKTGLPTLKDLKTEILVIPTNAIEAMTEDSMSNLSVNEDGDLTLGNSSNLN